MPVARPRNPNLTWSIVLYSRIVSCCIEISWEIEQADFARRQELAKNWGNQNFKILREAIEPLPCARTDRIWPALRDLGKELIGHRLWMWTNEGRPLVVWHSKFLESPDWVGAEYFDWSRFDRFMKRATVLKNTFAELKLMLVRTNERTEKELNAD
jgi:hypothetical protein